LYLDVNERTGSIKLNFPDLEVWELPETCALDIADRGGITLEEVGEIMNLTRERIRQLETAASRSSRPCPNSPRCRTTSSRLRRRRDLTRGVHDATASPLSMHGEGRSVPRTQRG